MISWYQLSRLMGGIAFLLSSAWLCAERKEEGPHAAEWHVKEDSDEASWNDGVEAEEEGLDLCIPKIWLS